MSSILDGKIEEVLESILEGKTFREIAKIHNVGLSTLHRFINSEEHSARARNAMEISASSYADKAEEVLILAENDRGELMRARELAQHYRWKAGKRSPKKYGDKVDVTTGGDKIAPQSIPLVLSDGRTYEDLKEDLTPE